MNLPSSLFVTAVIFTVVWFAVAYQPGHEAAYVAAYEANEGYEEAQEQTPEQPLAESQKPVAVAEPVAKPQSVAPEKKSEATTYMNGLALEGENRRMAMADVDALWTVFMGRSELHSRLNRMRVNAYVLYRDFSEDFSQADITLGYSSGELKGEGKVVARTPSGDYQEVLAPGKHSQYVLGKAWEAVDFNKPVAAVLERHELNSSGVVVASSIYVLYR